MLVAKKGRINSNYINVSMMLNLISNKSIEHGPIELVFTSDIKSFEINSLPKRIVTLNRSPKGFIYFGGAGKSSFESSVSIEYMSLPDPESWVFYKLPMGGFTGGQSIHLGYGNALKILVDTLSRTRVEIRLSNFCGGGNQNFIPKYASVGFFVKEKDQESLTKSFITSRTNIFFTYADEYPTIVLEKQELDPTDYPKVFKHSFQENFLKLILAIPHGVDSYKTKGNLPDTSVNLGCVCTGKNKLKIEGVYCFNSDIQQDYLEKKLSTVFRSHGAVPRFSSIHVPWIPKEHHEFFHLVCKTYSEMFGHSLRITSSHKSLDANVIAEKRPDSEIVVFGPVIEGVYTDNECIDTDSVTKTWEFLLELIKK